MPQPSNPAPVLCECGHPFDKHNLPRQGCSIRTKKAYGGFTWILCFCKQFSPLPVREGTQPEEAVQGK